MQKHKKKKLPSYMLFAPAVLGALVFFFYDWATGPHTGSTGFLEWCGHWRANTNIGTPGFPYFHCVGDSIPLLTALVRYIAFLGFLTIVFVSIVVGILSPFLIYAFMMKKTKNALISLLCSLVFFIVILSILMTILLKIL